MLSLTVQVGSHSVTPECHSEPERLFLQVHFFTWPFFHLHCICPDFNWHMPAMCREQLFWLILCQQGRSLNNPAYHWLLNFGTEIVFTESAVCQILHLEFPFKHKASSWPICFIVRMQLCGHSHKDFRTQVTEK